MEIKLGGQKKDTKALWQNDKWSSVVKSSGWSVSWLQTNQTHQLLPTGDFKLHKQLRGSSTRWRLNQPTLQLCNNKLKSQSGITGLHFASCLSCDVPLAGTAIFHFMIYFYHSEKVRMEKRCGGCRCCSHTFISLDFVRVFKFKALSAHLHNPILLK